MANVFFIERNIHGAWVIHGIAGTRQYYGYTKRDTMRLYAAECRKQAQFINR